MRQRRFICKNCRTKFEELVYEKGEAEAENKPSYPIRCPKCGKGNIVPI
jgi:RNase P subunit RPR2